MECSLCELVPVGTGVGFYFVSICSNFLMRASASARFCSHSIRASNKSDSIILRNITTFFKCIYNQFSNRV